MSTRSPIDEFIRIVALFFLIGWCSYLLLPFISMILWGIIIAVTIYPVHKKLSQSIGQRNSISALIITIFLLAIIAVPAFIMIRSVMKTVSAFHLGEISTVIPPPPSEVQEWPIIGESLYSFWMKASTNLAGAVSNYQPEILSAGKWALGTLGGLALDLIKFVISIIIAGMLLYNSRKGSITAHKFFTRIAGSKGESFSAIAEITVRNVSRGIIGVAFIQSLLAGLGFMIGKVPMAGVLTLLCLILSIVQIGISPIVILTIIYAFSTFSSTHAIGLTVWLIIVTSLDNILKPVMLGKGAPVPMIVVFLGAIGGFLASGLIGLFVGAVILSLGYRLFLTWVEEPAGNS